MADNKKKVVKEVVEKDVCKPEKDLFHKISKHTWAATIPGGCLVEHKGALVFVPGVRVLEVGDEHVLAKI